MKLSEAKAALAAAQEAYKAADEAHKVAGERARVAMAAVWEAERAIDRAKPLGKQAREMLTRMATAPVMIVCDRYIASPEEHIASALVELGFATKMRFGAMLQITITDAGRAKLGGKP